MIKLILGFLIASTLSAVASAENDYRVRVQTGIVNLEDAVVGTLSSFQPPLNRDSAFCFSFNVRSSSIDLNSLYRLLRDKDAEAILPQVEKSRQADVRASLGSDAYDLIEAKLGESVTIHSKFACKSGKDQASLKRMIIAIFANLIKAHSSLESDGAVLYAGVNHAGAAGLLTSQEIAELKQLASQ